jgi:hypothetical protein
MKYLFILLSLISLEIMAKEVLYTGIAKNENGGVAYIEKHKVVYKSGKIQTADTTYYAPDGKRIIAEMNSEFSFYR